MKSAALTIATVVLLAVRPLQGQSRVPVDSLRAAVGQRVRVRALDSNVWLRGRLTATADSSVVILVARDTLRLTLHDLAAAQRSRGHDRIGDALAGLIIGIPAGALIELGVGKLQERHEPSNFEFRGIEPAVGTIAGAIGGAILGPIIGAVLSPEQWADIGHRTRR